jgi:hypothetical protein
VQCILCGWADEWDGEEDADEVRPGPDPEDPLDWEWPNRGYSLTGARRNFEERGVMFGPGDLREQPFAATDPMRRQLKELFDTVMADESDRHGEEWAVIEWLRCAIID